MIKFNQITKLPEEYIKQKIESYLEEDRMQYDVTTQYAVPNDVKCAAVVEAESECVFVGEQIIKCILNNEYKLILNKKDGDVAQRGCIIAEIEGNAAKLLSIERVLLNIIQRLSGIATTTRKYSEIANPYGVKILDTRKTTPGMRLLEKYAVNIGGGSNHRLDLSTDILIKDNHINAGGGIKKVIQNVNVHNKSNLNVELEVDTIEQLKEGLELNVKGFLLDNMPPTTIKEAVNLIRNHKNGDDIFIEASGGITIDNLSDYVKTGVNAISIGALTHRIVSADIHINFLKTF
jgi:nicotinate-nucleotide pyrophosphorylase (carboxylating)